MVRKRPSKGQLSASKQPKKQPNTLDTLDINQEAIQQVVLEAAMQVSFSGPLPPPEMLADYEKVLPGAADRIISLAENEQQLRGRDDEQKIRRDHIMIWGSVIVSIAMIVGIVLCAYFGQPFVGSILVVIGLLPSVFKSVSDFRRLMWKSGAKPD